MSARASAAPPPALIDARRSVPEEIAHAVQPAPARGDLIVERERAPRLGYVAGPDDTGLRIRRADVFDRMDASARRAFLEPYLTPGQVMAARRYRDAAERFEAGISARSTLSSMLPQGGGGGDLSAMDMHLINARRLDAAVRAIGGGVALAVRRVRPSARGGARRSISDRALVDALAIADLPLDAVLAGHGWAKNGDTRRAVLIALAGALERLRGAI